MNEDASGHHKGTHKADSAEGNVAKAFIEGCVPESLKGRPSGLTQIRRTEEFDIELNEAAAVYSFLLS